MKVKRFMCDRCRRDFPIERSRKQLRMVLRSVDGDHGEMKWGRRRVELCTECETSFRTWLGAIVATTGNGVGNGATASASNVNEVKPPVQASDYRLVVNRPAPPSSKTTGTRVESRAVTVGPRVESRAVKLEPKDEDVT